MDKQQLYSLLTKHQNNACTEEELAELELWYQSLDTNNQSIGLTEAESFADEMLLHFKKKMAPEKLTIPLYKRYFGKIAIAASVFLTLGIGSYLIFSTNWNQNEIAESTNNAGFNDVTAPKSTKAMITLTNGETVLLDSVMSGKLATQGNVNVVKTADGQIVYEGTSTVAEYNTFTNPRGSIVQQLTLSDGTKVWLNSESSLRYPTAFTGPERRVEITGEAYFEVAHNAAKPFIVKDISRNAQVQVLGTHFNINTYSDEMAMKVTLLEGSVNVVKGNAAGLLKPGQQAQVTATVKIVNIVDIDAVMAWKNGFFHFGNTNIQDLMKQLARWYDVEIVFEGKIPARQFGGEISKEENLLQVLKILNESKVSCRIEGKKLIIE